MSNGSVYEDGGEALRNVNMQAATLADVDNQSERGYAHLGWLLLEVAEMQYWRVKYPTFREYLKTVAQISKKSVGNLQQYFLTVRDLSDVFTREQLEIMGISKAIKVRQAKDYALVLPSEIKIAALDTTVTVKDLKKIIALALLLPEEEDDDKEWMDIELMASGEGLALIRQAFDVARHTDPLTKSTISEAAQNYDIMQKLCMEFLGAHSGDGN